MSKHTAQHGTAQITLIGLDRRSVTGFQVFGKGGDLIAYSNKTRSLLCVVSQLTMARNKPENEAIKNDLHCAEMYVSWLYDQTTETTENRD